MTQKPDIIIPRYLELKASPIEGWGIFTTEPVKKDQNLGEFLGIEMNHTEFKKKYGNDLRYTCRKTRQHLYRVAKDYRNFITYINDGVHNNKNPYVNVYIKNWCCYASCDIDAGQELLLDYGKRYWK
jgi:SET domain-containing protein